jgi:hypothetical protein
MNTEISLRIELGVAAQKILQQIQLHHGTVEEQVEKGVQLAINDICNGDAFVQSVREATKQELAQIVNKAVLSWETRSRIEKLVAEKIGEKVGVYADQLAETITASLK